MEQEYTLITGYSIRAPDKVFVRHHDAKSLCGYISIFFSEIIKHRLCRCRFSTRFCRMGCSTINRKAIHFRPSRNDTRLICVQRRLVRRVTCRNEKLHLGKNHLVIQFTVAIRTRSDTHRIIEYNFWIFLGPCVGLLGCIKALVRIIFIKRFIHTVSSRHHAGKIKRRGRTSANNIKLILVLSRHHITRELERREFMINHPVRSLHGKHPVQVVLNFGKQIRQIAFGRDVPLERLEVIREMFVKRKERVSRDTRVHNVAAIVARIVPAFARFDCSRTARRIMKRNSRIRMARIAFPLACILLFESHGRTLVIVPLERGLCDIFKNLVCNFQIRAEHLPALLDAVRARSLQFREIDELYALTARTPLRSGLRRHREHRLSGGIYNFNIATAFEQCKFFRIRGAVTDLVDIGRCRRRRRRKRKRRHRD